MRCSCLLLLGSLIWYFSRQLNPWNILEKVSLQNSRQQAVFFQPWFLYITSSYLHLCCAMSFAHLCRQRSEGRGRRHGCEVFPEGWRKTSLASISRFLSVPVTCQTSLLCPQTGTQLPGVVCLPSYASSHRAYFSSSWTLPFKNGKLKLRACEIHLPWCFCWSVAQQIFLGFAEPNTETNFRDRCRTQSCTKGMRKHKDFQCKWKQLSWAAW